MPLKEAKSFAKRQVAEYKVTGTVKWFNARSGFGYITRSDTKEDVYVHLRSIARYDERKAMPSLADGETVVFNIVYVKNGIEATNVSGPDDMPVRGSPYIADKKPTYRRYLGRRAPLEVTNSYEGDKRYQDNQKETEKDNIPPFAVQNARIFYGRRSRQPIEEESLYRSSRRFAENNRLEDVGDRNLIRVNGATQETVPKDENKVHKEETVAKENLASEIPRSPKDIIEASWNLSEEADNANEASYYYNLFRGPLFKK